MSFGKPVELKEGVNVNYPPPKGSGFPPTTKERILFMKYIRKFLGVLFLIGSIICLIMAYQQYEKYKTGNEEYQQISKKNTNCASIEYPDAFLIDWEKLLSENQDCVGWIRMNPTVNYPIVQGTSNQEYLHKGFNGKYNINGTIFMHYQNKKDWSDKNTILYGHNMINGSMFGSNDKYKDVQYAKNHPYFYIYTPQGCYTYKIFDTIIAADATYPYELNLTTEEAFSEYLKQMNHMKLYGLDVPISPKDRIVTLSTCTSHGRKRFIIQGVLDSFRDTKGNTYTRNLLGTPLEIP